MSAEPKATLERLLHHMGFVAAVEEQSLDEGVLLNIKMEDGSRLIGRQGQTLADLQYLTNRLLFQQDQNAPKVTVDVDGYRTKALESLIKKALDAAEKVHRWGDIVELAPMNSYDRRIVHNALKDLPYVTTESVEVEGTNKKAILLRPKAV